MAFKTFLAIAVCKVLKVIGKMVGKGSSLPGKLALKIDCDILSKVQLPENIIAVTGSNGKTSTVEMIAHILKCGGKKVVWNKEGSNQIEGVTTLILSNCSFSGKMKADILLIESDERYAKYTFKFFRPTHYVITNLYRDQLTRNGHPQWVYAALQESIYDETRLILNADDPLVSLFGDGRDNNVWFGLNRFDGSTEDCVGMYRDGTYCPKCYGKMKYEYYHYNHIGKYACPNCGHHRHDTDFTVTGVDLAQGLVEIDHEIKIQLALHSLYNVYNFLAAYTVCSLMGIDKQMIGESIGNYIMKNGRVVQFELGEHMGTLLTSKHENSVSYDHSIRYVSAFPDKCSVLLIVDAVSRKYFTSETSWLWDIYFDGLNSPNIQSITLCGAYANDLAVRFAYTDIPQAKIRVESSIEKEVAYLKENGDEKLFVITCFSDKDKLLSSVKVL